MATVLHGGGNLKRLVSSQKHRRPRPAGAAATKLAYARQALLQRMSVNSESDSRGRMQPDQGDVAPGDVTGRQRAHGPCCGDVHLTGHVQPQQACQINIAAESVNRAPRLSVHGDARHAVSSRSIQPKRTSVLGSQHCGTASCWQRRGRRALESWLLPHPHGCHACWGQSKRRQPGRGGRWPLGGRRTQL